MEQTRRDYVANVSHELRTPISSIRSLAETLNDGLVKKEEDCSRYYGYILRESLRLTRLINDLLELSRLQSGAVALEKNEFALDGVVEEVTEQMRLVASYSGIRIKTDWHCARPLNVHSNRDRIEQVVIALVDNAIKFASDEGTITLDVSLSGDGRHAIVAVKNTGHIDEKHLPHLFERFYKADAAHSDGGTGLGLAIVQEVLANLGESIEARNEDEKRCFPLYNRVIRTKKTSTGAARACFLYVNKFEIQGFCLREAMRPHCFLEYCQLKSNDLGIR